MYNSLFRKSYHQVNCRNRQPLLFRPMGHSRISDHSAKVPLYAFTTTSARLISRRTMINGSNQNVRLEPKTAPAAHHWVRGVNMRT